MEIVRNGELIAEWDIFWTMEYPNYDSSVSQLSYEQLSPSDGAN